MWNEIYDLLVKIGAREGKREYVKTSEQIRAKFKFAYRVAIVTNPDYAFNLKKLAELDWPDHKVYVTKYNDSYEVLVVK